MTSDPVMTQDVAQLFSLAGKTAIITGGSSGLGAVLAVGHAAAGADIVICGRRLERLEATAREISELGREAVVVQADVTSVDDCQKVVETAMRTFGRIDALVNNAGVAGAIPAVREDPEHFRRIVDVNLHGAYWMAQACGRVMTPGSSVLNIGSVLGTTTLALPQAAYCASKAAIEGLTRDLAQQWTGRKGIRVNALAPGIFPTEMTAEYPDGYLEAIMHRIPAGRVGEPREIVGAAVFLASDAASYISGVVLPVDGGLLTT